MNLDNSDIRWMPTGSGKLRSTIRRYVRPISVFLSWQPSLVAVFCFGLMTGAPGGLLLGRTAAVALRSLGLLTDNKLLMHNLHNYIAEADLTFRAALKERSLSRASGADAHVFVSVLAEEFGVFTFSSSAAAGVFVGLSVYELVVRKRGQTATGEALALAGAGCLLGVAAAGCLLGWALEPFLSNTSGVSVVMWLDISQFLAVGLVLLFIPAGLCFDVTVMLIVLFLTPLTLPAVVIIVFTISLIFQTKLTLMVALMPVTLVAVLLRNPNVSRLSITPVPLMLMVTDMFNFARRPIVTIQSTTNASDAVVEGLFVGVLTSQFLMVCGGVSLFLSSQREGAGKICAGAAAAGVAVLGVIESLVPVLGPGPAIGALIGVAGAVGVSLAAAGAVTDQYGKVGRLGVTMGAGLGAFLTSYSHGGLSGAFTALCAASVPVGFYLELLGWKPILGLCTFTTLTMKLCFSFGFV